MDVISDCDTCKNESTLRRKSKKVVRATFQRLLQSPRQCDREILLALIRRVFHLSYKLRCCKKIFGLEKSHNNAREKIRWFFSLAFDIANKLQTHLSVFQEINFLEGEENQNPKRNTEIYLFSGFENGIFSRLRTEIENWKICHRPSLAVYLKIFLSSVCIRILICSLRSLVRPPTLPTRA